jgi:8-oxo-dGTP pyrophosphatase MutT (NUDIX family)
MTLADRLAKALALEHRRRPVLIEGDPHDPLDGPHATTTPAAVLMPVVDRPEPTVILTVRAETVRRHAGQIAFPGGRIDPGDDGPVAAALREAEEEIGLPPAEVRVLGTTDRYRTITGYEVTPVVGMVMPDLQLTPQPDEVAAIFEAPLDYLLRPEHQMVRTVQWQGRQRTYFEIVWEDRRIWGATAAMIVNLSRRMAVIA